MSKNKRVKMRQGLALINEVLQIELSEPGAFPGRSIKKLKEAKSIINKDLNKHKFDKDSKNG